MTAPKETARARAREARLEWSHLAGTLPVTARASRAFRTVAWAVTHRPHRATWAGALVTVLSLSFTTSIPAAPPAFAASHTLSSPHVRLTEAPRTSDHPHRTAPAPARVLTARAWAADGSPTAEQIAAQHSSSPLNLNEVVAAAKALLGVPYTFGGENPNGFDCSGYVRFVYAQTGLLLPHSASAQDALGAPVTPPLARPGDLVIWNDGSHSAIYAGHGQIFHAPKPGGRVELVPIFTDAVHYVRVARD